MKKLIHEALQTALWGGWLTVLALTGCQDEWEEKNDFQDHVLKVSVESTSGSRTALDAQNRVSWVPGDQFSLFGTQTGSNALPFQWKETDAQGISYFTGDLAAAGQPVLAYYPYDAENHLSEEKDRLIVNMPETYDYTTLPNGPMLGTPQADGTLHFKHLMGLLKFTILRLPADAAQLCICAHPWDSDVAGSMVLDDLNAAEPVLTAVRDGRGRELFINLPADLAGKDVPFLIPIPATVYGAFTTIQLLDKEGNSIWHRRITGMEIRRGRILNLGDLYAESVFHITSHADGEVVKGLGAIRTIYLEGYYENFNAWQVNLELTTEEKRSIRYDNYYNPGFPHITYKEGERVNFKVPVEIHRGVNKLHFHGKCRNDRGSFEYDRTMTLVYEEDDTPAEMVDLGLSVKWASHNMGAKEPWEEGYRYTWGDNTGTDRNHADKEDYDRIWKQNPNRVEIGGDPDFDAATYKWKGGWRIPSKDEMEELLMFTTQEIVEVEGMTCVKLTGKNGNYILMPYPKEDGLYKSFHYFTSTQYFDVFGHSLDSGFGGFSLEPDDRGSFTGKRFYHLPAMLRPVYKQ